MYFLQLIFLYNISYRLFPMNSPQEKPESVTTGASSLDNKIKLNQLSKCIFDKICENRQISDNDVMKYLINEFGSVKEETLKRRKYDTVNILEKADIISIEKKEGNYVYIMKHDVPNSVKDLEHVKERLQQKLQMVKYKENKLNMMRTATNNYRRLIEVNQLRKKQRENAIQLPVIAVTEKFIDFCADSEDSKQTLKMKFPAGAKFINNMLAHTQIFNF